jgi:hypothetical protein
MIYSDFVRIASDECGRDRWVCAHCGEPADHGQGRCAEPEKFVYVLICPSGKATLGEWLTVEEKFAELSACYEKLKLEQIGARASTRESRNDGCFLGSVIQG